MRLPKLGRCSRIALFNNHMLSEDKRSDSYGTTQITSIPTYIMVLSKHFKILNLISLSDYYYAQSSHLTSSHLQQHCYTYHAKHGGKVLSFISFLLSRWISLTKQVLLTFSNLVLKGVNLLLTINLSSISFGNKHIRQS